LLDVLTLDRATQSHMISVLRQQAITRCLTCRRSRQSAVRCPGAEAPGAVRRDWRRAACKSHSLMCGKRRAALPQPREGGLRLSDRSVSRTTAGRCSSRPTPGGTAFPQRRQSPDVEALTHGVKSLRLNVPRAPRDSWTSFPHQVCRGTSRPESVLPKLRQWRSISRVAVHQDTRLHPPAGRDNERRGVSRTARGSTSTASPR